MTQDTKTDLPDERSQSEVELKAEKLCRVCKISCANIHSDICRRCFNNAKAALHADTRSDARPDGCRDDDFDDGPMPCDVCGDAQFQPAIGGGWECARCERDQRLRYFTDRDLESLQETLKRYRAWVLDRTSPFTADDTYLIQRCIEAALAKRETRVEVQPIIPDGPIKAFYVSELSDEQLQAIRDSKVPPEYEYLNDELETTPPTPDAEAALKFRIVECHGTYLQGGGVRDEHWIVNGKRFNRYPTEDEIKEAYAALPPSPPRTARRKANERENLSHARRR